MGKKENIDEGDTVTHRYTRDNVSDELARSAIVAILRNFRSN